MAALPALRLEAAPDLAGRERAVRQQGFAFLPALLDADRIAALREAMAAPGRGPRASTGWRSRPPTPSTTR